MLNPDLNKADHRLTEENCATFRVLTKELVRHAANAGVSVVAFHDPNLNLFRNLSAQAQYETLDALKKYLKICIHTVSEKGTVHSVPALTWSALRAFGFRPPSDLFDHIDQDSIIEIHSPMGVQLFRNFNFYKYCSYTIEELYCGTWGLLYERDESVMVPILEFAKEVFTGSLRQVKALEAVPRHVVREVSSVYRYEILLEMAWGAPLFQDKTATPVATIVVENATLVSSSNSPN